MSDRTGDDNIIELPVTARARRIEQLRREGKLVDHSWQARGCAPGRHAWAMRERSRDCICKRCQQVASCWEVLLDLSRVENRLWHALHDTQYLERRVAEFKSEERRVKARLRRASKRLEQLLQRDSERCAEPLASGGEQS